MLYRKVLIDKRIKNLYVKMINSKKNLGIALFVKWKAMGDANNEHRIASKIEGKMNQMI